MLAYLATKAEFLSDAATIEDIVRDQVRQKLNINVGESEYRAWRNSLGNAMSNVMRSSRIPDDAGVAIEYRLDLGRKRIDFMLSGRDHQDNPSLYIIELKQWEKIEESETRDHVKTYIGGAIREELHPSYQAWSYQSRLESYNEFIYETGVNMGSCSYLHNCPTNNVVGSSRYEAILSKSPVFIKGQMDELTEAIEKQIVSGSGIEILKSVDASPIRPSARLADAVGNMLKGIEEFILLDEQKTVYEKILESAKKSQTGKKQVIIVDGGPGTGKSVISINALASLTKERMNTRYVTANGAPRDVFKAKLSNELTSDAFKQLFSGSGSFHSMEKDSYDVLIADEAHRLTAKSGFYKNEGENQIKEIIGSAKTSVFFIDEAQKVTWADIGEKESIRNFAKEAGAELQEYQLTSQFRCNGSDDYLAWLEQFLGVKPSDGQVFSRESFDFQVFDNPTDLHEEIKRLNKLNGKSRMVAGYCWNWISKNDFEKRDIVIDSYRARWNLQKYDDSWIINPNSVNEVGCIHTCQGLEVEYVGVIIGNDLRIESGTFITDPSARAKTDKSLSGFKKSLQSNEVDALKKADELIRNTYRTLMSRGMKGCYVYCTDKKTNEYLKSTLKEMWNE
ncbi:MAG: DNA/RNA helicase domain-containing protein [Actinomycetota bacterium]